MNPFGGGGDAQTNLTTQGMTAETWSNMASGNPSSEDDGFLNPESTLPSNRSLRASEWSKERSAQQLELSSVHHTNDAGICSRALEFLVKGLHPIDLGCGIASVTYGALLASRFAEPAMAAALFCLILGTVHLIASALGMLSYFAGGCRRFGLKVSGVTGPYIAFVYLTIVVSWAADEEGFLEYLDENKGVLFLGPNVAANCKRLMPLAYTILAVLGLLEALRFSVTARLRERLLARDEADALVPVPSRYEQSSGTKGRPDGTLTAALLEGGDAASIRSGISASSGGAVTKETTGTPNWWDNEGG